MIVSKMYDISQNMKPTFQNYFLQRPMVAKLIIRAFCTLNALNETLQFNYYWALLIRTLKEITVGN